MPGSTFRFFVRGLDAGGQAVTGWAKSRQFSLSVFDSSINSAGWTTRSGYRAYRGTLAATSSGSTAGDIRYEVNGFAMGIVAPKFPGGGAADVYVDGTRVSRISLNSPTSQAGHIVFSWTWPTNGRHEVRLDPIAGQIELDAGLNLTQNCARAGRSRSWRRPSSSC